MHEMSLCESLVQIIEQEARKQAFTRVTAVWLEIGPFAGAEPEAMRFCFDAVSRGTLAEAARFEIVPTAGKAFCFACGEDVAVAERFAACPLCGGHQLQITGGEELRIKELEVD
ncbi:MAG: hydrogenase maturation nickel metallochaperone HypA [Bauldia sp.]|nr:MAG: hydrogenase maturation nickel metallochaperone HypA [Bauldia sp.]